MKTGILPNIYNHRHNNLHEILAKVKRNTTISKII